MSDSSLYDMELDEKATFCFVEAIRLAVAVSRGELEAAVAWAPGVLGRDLEELTCVREALAGVRERYVDDWMDEGLNSRVTWSDLDERAKLLVEVANALTRWPVEPGRRERSVDVVRTKNTPGFAGAIIMKDRQWNYVFDALELSYRVAMGQWNEMAKWAMCVFGEGAYDDDVSAELMNVRKSFAVAALRGKFQGIIGIDAVQEEAKVTYDLWRLLIPPHDNRAWQHSSTSDMILHNVATV